MNRSRRAPESEPQFEPAASRPGCVVRPAPDGRSRMLVPGHAASFRRGLGTTVAVGLVVGAGLPAAAQQPVSPELTPKLQDLLRREMLSVEDASQQILSALIAGDDARVADLAQQIHDSFILKQEMTPEDREDLVSSVPEEFVQMDRSFHELSGELAEAAKVGDRQLQQERFAQMLEACTACHSSYATNRFPGFGEAGASD